ncbi:Pleckstrin homology domain-containing family B member 2 [Halotydeus destructor]|nr:Pleckstrin homology domain-containing family B member 2 [Halotydeus destructor]
MDNSVIAKSGWLYRKGVDCPWEKNWIELYRDGNLKYYESDHSPNAEDIILMPSECISIKTGCQVEPNVLPPRRFSNQCYFSVTTSSKHWHFCAENLEDMRSWQLALEQSRLMLFHRTDMRRTQVYQQFRPQLVQQRGHHPAFPYYGTLPPTYLPAFTDGANTLVPTHYPYNHHDTPYGNINSHPSIPNQYSVPARHPSITPSRPQLVRPDGRDVAVGMLAGAAVGSVMWGPYFWSF